jgi:hypothetical protein
MKSTTSASPRLPDATSRRNNPNSSTAAASLLLLLFSWRYVVARYVTKPGDPWRSDAIRPVSDRF